MEDPILSITYASDELTNRIQRLEKKLGDLTPAFKAIGEYKLLTTDQGFEKEVDPDGIPWKPNSPRTIALKRSQGRIQKILQATGQGRNSITYEATRERVVIGTNVQHMVKHQIGDGVPVRKFLGINEKDEAEFIAIFDEYLKD